MSKFLKQTESLQLLQKTAKEYAEITGLFNQVAGALMSKDMPKKDMEKFRNYVENDMKEDAVQLRKLERDLEYYGREVITFASINLTNQLNVKLNDAIDLEQGDFFFGKFLLKTNKVYDVSYPAMMAVGFNKRSLNLYINPLMVGLECENYNNVIAVLKHEMMHLIYKHLVRYKWVFPMGEKYSLMMNYATDCAINQKLKYLPEGCVYLNTLEERIGKKLKPHEDSMYYYNALAENEDEFFKDSNEAGDGSGGESQEGGGNGQPQQGNGSGSSDAEMDKRMKDTHGQWEESDGSDATTSELVDQFLKNVYNSMSMKERGHMSGDMKSIYDELLKPAKRDWRSVFKRYMGTLSVPYKYTKTRLNRRQPNRLELSGRLMNKMVKITVAVDTSGSMSDNILAYCASEIQAMLKGYDATITYIQFDSSIKKVESLKNLNDMTAEFEGRGGTSFQPVFDYTFEKHYQNNEDLLLVMTDGYGERDIDTHGFNKVIWLIVDGEDDALSVKDYPGIRVALNDDTNFQKVFKK